MTILATASVVVGIFAYYYICLIILNKEANNEED